MVDGRWPGWWLAIAARSYESSPSSRTDRTQSLGRLRLSHRCVSVELGQVLNDIATKTVLKLRGNTRTIPDVGRCFSVARGGSDGF